MKTRTANANQPSVLTLEGRFDMDVQMRFRNAYRKLLAETPGSELVVDMGAVEYMDSSALGGLLLLREETGKRGIAVKLAGCRPPIKQILATAHFNQLFALTAA